MSRPWMPLYVGDYLRDTAHLTALEHGAYLLLICHYWEHGPLPDDDRQFARIARLSLFRWKQIRPTMLRFFVLKLATSMNKEASAEQLVCNWWHHKRVDAELERAEIISLKRKIAGARGGQKSNGLTNMQRYINGAIGKQTGDHSPSKKDKGAAEKSPVVASGSLAQSIKEKGWA